MDIFAAFYFSQIANISLAKINWFNSIIFVFIWIRNLKIVLNLIRLTVKHEMIDLSNDKKNVLMIEKTSWLPSKKESNTWDAIFPNPYSYEYKMTGN